MSGLMIALMLLLQTTLHTINKPDHRMTISQIPALKPWMHTITIEAKALSSSFLFKNKSAR